MASKNKIAERAVAKVRGYNNLLLLTIGTLIVTFVVLSISMFLYKVSGTAQLDLSRPGYESVRPNPDQSTGSGSDTFSATGPIDEATIRQFNALFDETADRIRSVDAFRPEALSNEAFGISE